VLLTNDTQLTAGVSAYLTAHPADTLYAVGGPAAASDPKATPIVGTDRYDTSAKVATTFFNPPNTFGVASGVNYPDALAGSATMAEDDSPLLLTDPNTLSAPTATYLAANKASFANKLFYIFGGPLAISNNVQAAIGLAIVG